jgi:CheY-like chemotaxis protein
VLIVEDDEDVLNSTAGLLSSAIRSSLPANGPEAFAELRGSERIDILFADVVLPGA